MTVLNEIKNQKNLIGNLLTILEPTIDKMVKRSIEWLEQDTKRPATKFDWEYTELFVISDLVNSFEKYTIPTDVFVELSSNASKKGNLEISSVINRDDVDYSLYTEVIYAGGHNIQRLHYRYITKTKLQRMYGGEFTKKIKGEINRISKIQKLEKEIGSYEKRIIENSKKIEKFSKFNENEIIEFQKTKPMYYEFPTWKEICDRGVSKNYNNDENFFNKEKEENRLNQIESFKTFQIGFPTQNSNGLKKTLERLRKKLNTLK